MNMYLRRGLVLATTVVAITIANPWAERGGTSLIAQGADKVPGPIIEDPPGIYQGQSFIARQPSLLARGLVPTTFIVTYNGFSSQARTAFQAAVDVWAAQIQSSVPIRITATWTVLGPGVLGSAGPNFIHRNFAGAPVANTYYPDALADKLAGVDLGDGDPDILANFNSNFDWYYGTDGNAGMKYDLMTVVLHELGHGLGFLGSMDGFAGVGSWGVGSPRVPLIYDLFAINGSSQALLNTSLFPNPSAALAAQLVGNNIYFNGANARAANGDVAARLYAPDPWRTGSSYSHLSESTFPIGTPHSLMTPQLGPGEAIHDPGAITRGLFTDSGWNAAPLSVTGLTANRTFPVTANTAVTWTATASGGTAPYTYAFWVYNGSAWTLGQDWSSSNTWTWTPATPGTYSFQLWVRNAGSATTWDAWRGAGPVVVTSAAPLTATGLTANRTFPVTANTAVTWTATASGGTAPYTYAFWVYNGSTWTLGQDWSSSNTWTWTPATPGTYSFQLWVRNAGSATTWDAWRGAGPVVVRSAAPLNATGLTANRTFPVTANTAVTWTATASGGTAPYTYAFWVYNGSTWTLGQDWSSSNTWTWTPATPGTYSFQLWVRNAGSATTWDAWRGAGPVVVKGAAPLNATGLTANRTFPVTANTAVTWTATASGGTAPYTYAFWVYNGSTWTLGQDWSSSNTWTWTPATPGTYSFQLWVRNAGSATTWDAWRGAGPAAIAAP